MQRPLGAQISHMLKARGVETIFGIPGVHNQEMYRGIEEAGITHVLARHEQGAGFMADGYARATGKPGVAYVITGPGLCNIMTPMGQAYSDSVPMLVISSCLDRGDLGMGRGRLHEMKDQEGAAATVCDWSKTAPDAAHAYHLIDKALQEFATGRARPKHIQVEIGTLQAMAPPPPAAAARAVGAKPAVTPEAVAKTRALLAGAQRPLLLFGGGAVSADATPLLARIGAAAFTTYAGRGVVAPDAPLSFGSMLARPGAEAVIAGADLILAIGTELNECDIWRSDLGNTVPLIRVDIDPAVLASADTGTGILADAGLFVAALHRALGDDWIPATGWSAREVSDTTARWRAEIDAERPGILRVADALRAALPAETMIFSDMTQFAYGAKEVWPMPTPGHWHHPYGFGTLGYALPAAIGGKIGRGAAPVIAIAGDYGFQYTIQELAVAVELELPLPIILWDNGKLGEIEDSMVRAQIAPNAVIQRNPDFLKLAEAYGAHGVEPAALSELPDVLATAFAANRPTLIRLTPDQI